MKLEEIGHFFLIFLFNNIDKQVDLFPKDFKSIKNITSKLFMFRYLGPMLLAKIVGRQPSGFGRLDAKQPEP